MFGNHGLWAALMVMNAARGLTLYRAYPGIAQRLLPAHPAEQF
jgi:MATE family multidrug resistance protein